MGHEQRRVRRRPDSRLRQEEPHGPRMHHIDYGLGVLSARRSTRCRRTGPTTWPRFTRDLLRARRAGRLRGRPSGSTKSVPSRGSKESGGVPLRRGVHDISPNSFWPKPPKSSSGSTWRPSSAVADIAGRMPRGRRTAVHPGRGRQRGQRVARGQRFPQDRGLEAYAPTDNVSRADRAHQRRRLGRRLRGLAAGQPSARGRMPC